MFVDHSEVLTKGDYMGKAQLAFFESMLVAERALITSRQAEARRGSVAHEITSDPSDRATNEEESQAAASAMARDLARLRDIDAAMVRIRSGEYGYCVDSGDEIGIDRLKANPAALRTFECQNRFELKSRQYQR